MVHVSVALLFLWFCAENWVSTAFERLSYSVRDKPSYRPLTHLDTPHLTHSSAQLTAVRRSKKEHRMTAEPRMRRRPAGAGGRSGASPRGNVIEDRDAAGESVSAFTSELWARLAAFVRELR